MLRRQCEFMLLSIKGRYSASKVTLKTTSFSQRSLPFIHSGFTEPSNVHKRS